MTSVPGPSDTEARPSIAPGSPLEERLRRLERELHAIRRISAALHARTDLDEMEQEALRVAIEALGASGGTIYLHDPQRHILVFKYVVAETEEVARKLQGFEMPDTQGVAGDVFQSGIGRITEDVRAERSHHSGVDERTSYRTKNILTVPLRSMGGHKLGVMQVLNKREGVFDEEDLAVLEILSSQAASAIETARLHEEARRASVVNLIGDISHDVKNLLTPVVSGSQTLEMMIETMLRRLDAVLLRLSPEDRQGVEESIAQLRGFYGEAMGMILSGAEDIQERVREIADAIKGIISEPHYEPCDLRERAEAVTKVLNLVAERRRIRIDLSGLQETGPVELDRRAIYNALYNLVNNAIPETPDGGVISVRSRLVSYRGEPGVEIQVADTGRGMPPHVRARMFTEHVVSTKPGGTGLGTRIVKNVVDSHGGTIRVDSEPGKGTTFTMTLPLRQPARGDWRGERTG